MTEIFSLEEQRKHVNALFNGIPTGHGHAKLKVTYPDGKVSFILAARVNDHWMLQGDVSYEIPDRRLGAKIESIWSW
jgi:hypothetical protein